MTGVRAYVGVQESDGKGRTFNLNKALHEVFVDVSGGIADAVKPGRAPARPGKTETASKSAPNRWQPSG